MGFSFRVLSVIVDVLAGFVVLFEGRVGGFVFKFFFRVFGGVYFLVYCYFLLVGIW